MVVQIETGKRENGQSFWDNLYRKRSSINNFSNIIDTRMLGIDDRILECQELLLRLRESRNHGLIQYQ